jgi:hypothetical protein
MGHYRLLLHPLLASALNGLSFTSLAALPTNHQAAVPMKQAAGWTIELAWAIWRGQKCPSQPKKYIYIYIFVKCSWVDTRWQYTFTQKQYIEQQN